MFEVRSSGCCGGRSVRGATQASGRGAGSEEDIGRSERCRPPPAGSEAAAPVLGGLAAKRSTGTAPWWLSAKQIWQSWSADAGMTGEVGRRQSRWRPQQAYVKRGWVMMPGEQNGLEEDRECAD